MKKFLSLVLALIMTMSLVTISAGATEYRDLTDKDEIQYEEAVAVLNRIGVITGYEDGSFRPETELTRGAAAKIIVSLMIGPDAASALPNNASPYPDVPAGHTFAGVIGYCKTAGYISGYGDGTFKPANPLTGYAFAKMLLGAIGYKSNIEGFVDTGWTMNVARIGNVAGLFDRISFDGAKAVTRDEACQLALNTLKATMVDYGNANTVVSSSGEVLTVQGSKAVYVTSNNRDINANINRRVISATNNELTLEFGEEHFKDLRLEHDRYDPAYDIYGHPSNEWSYKKVTIGTFKLPADFTFTKQMAHLEDTTATKEKALGLRNYDTYSIDHRGGYVNWSTAASDKYNTSPFADATQIHINGWNARVYRNDAGYKQTTPPTKTLNGQCYTYDARDIDATNKELAPSLSEICDLTDNGVTVEVYVCPVDADFITDVVVTRTQLMEVDRVASDYVELNTISSDSKDPRKDGTLDAIAGYNDYALYDEVISVKDNNYDAYNVLKDLKAGDEVAVIPYTADDGKTWEVGEAYVPETVSGALTNVDIYNTKSKPDGNAIAITVGGTTYPIAQWNKDMREITGVKIRSTKKDVTLLLDKMGNALLAKDVGNSNAWIIVGDYYQAAGASGRVSWFVHGWTIKGDEVDLELGTIRGAAEKYAPGELVKYDVSSGGNGEYELYKPNYNQISVLKNGSVAPWIEPKGATKDKVQTGEGIYNIAQFAKQYDGANTVDDEYNIKSVNTLLPLEFYNTDSNKKDTDPTTVAGVHYNYRNATANPNRPVGLTSENTPSTTYCGELVGTEGQFYNNTATSGEIDRANGAKFDEWTYRTAPYDGVKFIYVGFDSTNGEVEVINVVDGVQNVNYDELKQINRWWKNVGTNGDQFVASPAEAYVDKDGKVKAVVIKSDSAEANLKDLMIITDNKGANTSTKGGAEAPTSGTYYTRQYVSGEDGFKEEKTGYFDKALLVGDVVTGSLKEDGIIRAKYFHSASYTDRNPDGMYIKGIAPLTTQEGKESGNAFYVGTAHAGTKAVTLMLGTGVNGNNSYPLDDANCVILSGKDVLGVNDGTDKKGLIKVDGSTQWIDLRDGRPGDVDEIGDLFDYDNDENIELKLILNGNPSSDGFRHAYAVVILEAETGADDAAAPTLTVSAKDENGKPITAKQDPDTKVWTVKALPGTKVTLTANVGNVVVEQDAKWTVSGATTAGKVVDVYAPDTKGDKLTATFEVTNYDKDRKDATTKKGTMTVEIVADEPEADSYTLTLGGAIAAAGEATVLANDRLVSAVNGKYEIAKDASVRVVLTDPSSVDYITTGGDLDGKTFPINGVNVTFTHDAAAPLSGKDEISFKMTGDLDLVMFGQDDITGKGDEVVTITLKGGVTASYKPSGASEFATVTSGEGVVAGGTLRIDSVGRGAGVSGAKAATDTSAASVTDLTSKAVLKAAVGTGLELTGTVTSSLTLYSVSKLTSDVATTGIVASAGTATYVAIDEDITLGTTTGDAQVKAAASADAYSKDDVEVVSGKIRLTDDKDVYIRDVVKLNIGAGITNGTVGGVTVNDGDYAVATKAITFTMDDANMVAVENKAGAVAKEVPASISVTKGDEYVSMTKVVVEADSAANFTYKIEGFDSSPVTLTVATWGFTPGTYQFNSAASKTGDIQVTVGSTTADVSAPGTLAGGNPIVGGETGAGSVASVILKVNKDAITLGAVTA